MSTLSQPLSKYSTNAYILNDFSEIAYIVCTLAPSSGTDSATDSKSSDQTLHRLKNAETQFRQASILVALDAENLELFTFYKKVDVLKDQKTILSRFGQVCRLNSCIIARKNAARILDLLKPDSARVYQLFATAILSSVQLGASGLTKVVNITPTIALVPTTDSVQSFVSEYTTAGKLWYLKRVTLQMLATGQLILIIQQAKSGPLVQVSDLVDDEHHVLQPPARGSSLYLAPTGQMARYSGTCVLRTSRTGQTSLQDGGTPWPTASIQRHWVKAVLEWLTVRSDGLLDKDTDLTWVEVEIPLLQVDTNSERPPATSVVWKPLLWPAKLIYAFQRSLTINSNHNLLVDGTEGDPISFVHDWLMGAEERKRSILASTSKKSHDLEMKAELDSADNVTFEDPEPIHAFGPPGFAPSQIIYPTPPDGPATHPTPGMSSVDGLAPTPFPNSQQAFVLPGPVPELDTETDVNARPDIDLEHQAGEDLFGELHDDTFEVNEGTDEPNWDFFDRPSFDEQDSVAVNAGADANNGRAAASDKHPIGSPNQPRGDVDEHLATQDKNSTPANGFQHDHIEINEPDADIDLRFDHDDQPSQPKNNPVLQALTGKIVTESLTGNTAAIPTDDRQLPKTLTSEDTSGPNQSRDSRRPSLFDNVDNLSSSSINYDAKYQSRGKYWFQPMAVEGIRPSSLHPLTTQVEVASSDSDTTMSSWSSNASEEKASPCRADNITQQAWAEYHPILEVAGERDISHSEDAGDLPSPEVLLILDMIVSAPGDEPFQQDVAAETAPQSEGDYSPKWTNMLAQIIVNQVSQSFFFTDTESLCLQYDLPLGGVEVSMDHNEARTVIPSANLEDLTNIQHPSPTGSNSTKITSLRKPQIVVGRGDDHIQADLTILHFWDVLGLQPFHGSKNITSFCFHPITMKMADSCAAYLGRISDTYTAGNFGTHLLGHVSGFTGDGLVAWQGIHRDFQHLKTLCQAFGSALATSPSNEGMIVVYMICPDGDLTICRELCHAFAILSEAFAKVSSPSGNACELVLQLVPMSFVVSAYTTTVPFHQNYLDLAIEVYNRLPPKTDERLPASCASAVVLQKPNPKSIEFELTANAVDPLSRDGVCLHLAYSDSADGRWLVAAWTDECGKVALTIPYRMGVEEVDGRLRRDVLRDMWEVSHDIMSQETSRWRLAIAKVGFFEIEELNEWLQLVNQANQDRKTLARILLMSLHLDPSLMLNLKNPVARPLPMSVAMAPISNATPVTTPQNHTTSPDQGMPAAPTPGAGPLAAAASPSEQNFEAAIENDMVLVDPLEDSWSAILGFGLNQASDSISIRPAGSSALLIKSASIKDEHDTMTYIEVSLLATSRLGPTNPTHVEREAILQEMLEQFRRLVTLAATRGSIARERECVPWHVAASVKGAKALCQTL